ncbi:hypothetical protein B0T24DRAFT_619111 [Lasiosphaeria ovina]|uniref:Uncharacterized protein n=1 Tax=Lasiosphaeria ovina TaxID=92902 RepID=A0AAE0NBK1_9PEZI|nr:hypothetical protein B0T24DRAFT_619111 [Lasiosphaeria ovina]
MEESGIQACATPLEYFVTKPNWSPHGSSSSTKPLPCHCSYRALCRPNCSRKHSRTSFSAAFGSIGAIVIQLLSGMLSGTMAVHRRPIAANGVFNHYADFLSSIATQETHNRELAKRRPAPLSAEEHTAPRTTLEGVSFIRRKYVPRTEINIGGILKK